MASSRFLLVLTVAACSSAAAQNVTFADCPSGQDDVRIAALSGLAQLDADQVVPVMKRILERRDVCSIQLRRQVISMVGRSRFGEQTDVLLNVARSDPNFDLRRYAVQALAQSNTERSAGALDSIVFSNGDTELRDAALRALGNLSVPAARASLRRAAELTTLPAELRVKAVSYISCCRRSADDTPFLIDMYSKAQFPELREAAMRAIAEQRTPEAASWLLGIARDRNKDIEIRRQALSAIGKTVRSGDGSSNGVDLASVISLYDDFAGQIEMQDRVIDVIAQYQSSTVTDKLLEIAKSERNQDLRRKAVQRVGQRRDPRVREFLVDILSK